MKYTVNLPWPHKALFPNEGLSKLQKSRYVKKARLDAGWQTRADMGTKKLSGEISITRIYSPPDRRRRDKDNMDASTKPYLDGIADALGIDDNNFDLEKSHVIEPVSHGNILFIIEEKAG